MKSILVGQSGGPTAVINGSLYGVIKESQRNKELIDHIYGMQNGIEGFLKDHYIDLEEDFSPEKLEALKTTPGAYLGSCRHKLPEDLNDEIYPLLFDKFEALNIGYFLYIGGNDSMDTVSKLSRYAEKTDSDIRIIGVPKTIDNDLVETDHTPGFGSAAKYVATTVREIGMDASIYDTFSVTIVEIMGRHAGWLAASSILARKYGHDNPIYIYLPEVAFDQDAFIAKLEEGFEHTPNLVVCVSEGIRDKNGTFICEYDGSKVVDAADGFGHKILTGCGKYLENLVKERLNVKVRSIEFNISQRCSSGSQSGTDLSEAIEAGSVGTRLAFNGETGKMIAFKRKDTDAYEIDYVPVDVNAVCNKEKSFPIEWIINEGTDISRDFLKYVTPLIQGNPQPPEKDGMPIFAYRENER